MSETGNGLGRVQVMLADGLRAGTIVVLDQHSLVDRFAVPRSIGSDRHPLLPSDLAVDVGDEPHDSHRIVTAEGDENERCDRHESSTG